MAAEKDSTVDQDGMISKQPVEQKTKKRKKNAPDKPQPQWLFPPPAENPVLTEKTKTPEEVKQEFEDRMAAIRFLKYKSLQAPIKSAPPALLLTLVGSFLTSYGFNSASRLYTLERNARKRLDGWEGAMDKKLDKGTPDLVKIFRDWEKQWQEAKDLETSSDENESSAGHSSTDDEEDTGAKSRSKATNGQTRKEKKTIKKSPVAKDTSESGDSDDSSTSTDSKDSKSSANSDSSEDVDSAAKSPKKAAPRKHEAQAEALNVSDSSEDGTDQPSEVSSTTLHATPPLLSPQQHQTAPLDDTSSSESSSSEDEPAPASLPPARVEKMSKRKRSASPKGTAEKPSKAAKKDTKPFRRVPDDVRLDPRLASNAYVPYEYAERAHQDLVVTKGKEFTKEKNKKKRGSYRGGAIDTSGGKAIKFDETGN